MARKKKTLYTAKEMKELLVRLKARRDDLLMEADAALEAFKESLSFDDACKLRDASAPLVTVCMVIDNTLPGAMKLAKLTGAADSVPWLDECGLDD